MILSHDVAGSSPAIQTGGRHAEIAGHHLGFNDGKVREAVMTKLEELLQLVRSQSEDEGLWFIARTAPEAYLQQELRKLHALIEGNDDAS